MLAVNLLRAYGDRSTNGEIWIGDGLVCYTIELPWRENVRNISCIPEGTNLWPSDTANDLDGIFW